MKNYAVAIAFAVSTVVGTGIFGLTGLAVQLGGAQGSLFGWLAAAVCIVPFLFIFYQLGRQGTDCSKLLKSANVLCLFTYVLVVPIVAYVGAAYLQKMAAVPARLAPFFTVLLLSMAIAINCAGGKWLERVNRTAWVVLIAILAVTTLTHVPLLVLGLRSFGHALAAPSTLPSLASLSATTSLLLFAFIGWENLVLSPSALPSMLRRPSLVYTLSFAFVFILYFALALVLSGAKASGLAVSDVAGLTDLWRVLPGWPLFAAGAVLVVISNLTAWTYSASKVATAMGHSDRNALFSLYVLFVLVFGLLISEVTTISRLMQIVNKNFIVLYWFFIVLFFQTSRGYRRYAISVLAAAASFILLGEWSWHLLIPLGLMLSGYVRQALRTLPIFQRKPREQIEVHLVG